MTEFTLPPLPYGADALASRHMSQETLEFHHGKHHQNYVNTLNKLVAEHPEFANSSLDEIVKKSYNKNNPVFNNAGQHWNHSFFWKSLSPQGGKIPGKLEKKIIEDFGSVDAFKEQFCKAGASQFGSGWAWLVLTPQNKLAISKTPNAVNPMALNEGKALLTVDVWEHAYYLDYQNRRAAFLKNFVDELANYEHAESLLSEA